MIKKVKFLRLLESLAASSPVDHFRHSAIVLRGGAILSVGVNGNEKHAEEDALRKLWPSERRGTTLLSFRLKKDGPGLARPCKKCEGILRESGVKTVVYSTNEGEFVRERVR